MKKIVFTRSDGGLSVVNPAAGARLCWQIIGAFGVTLFRLSKTPVAVETALRKWYLPGLTIEWAETEDQFVERIRQTDVPKDALDVRVIEGIECPSDRTFRNAWTLGPDGVAVDLPKAREIHREHLRQLRAPLLAALDVEYQRADERGDLLAKQTIASKKQTLRDAPAAPAIDAAATPEELKAAIPIALLAAA